MLSLLEILLSVLVLPTLAIALATAETLLVRCRSPRLLIRSEIVLPEFQRTARTCLLGNRPARTAAAVGMLAAVAVVMPTTWNTPTAPVQIALVCAGLAALPLCTRSSARTLEQIRSILVFSLAVAGLVGHAHLVETQRLLAWLCLIQPTGFLLALVAAAFPAARAESGSGWHPIECLRRLVIALFVARIACSSYDSSSREIWSTLENNALLAFNTLVLYSVMTIIQHKLLAPAIQQFALRIDQLVVFAYGHLAFVWCVSQLDPRTQLPIAWAALAVLAVTGYVVLQRRQPRNNTVQTSA